MSSSASPRPRPTTSCLVCRKRKVKCDRVHPTCGKCLQNGLRCKYAAPGTKIRFVDGDPSRLAHRPLSNGLEDEREELQLFPPSPLPPPPPPPPPPQRSGPDPQSLDATQRTDAIFSGGRYLGGVFWGLANDGNPDDVQRLIYATCDPSSSYLAIDLVFSSLPPRHECDAYFDAFLTSINPIFPLVDSTWVTHCYASLWTCTTAIESSELLLIVAVLHAGHICTTPVSTSPLDNLFKGLLSGSTFESAPNLQLLQAFTLYHSSNVCEALPLSSYTFLPVAVRTAQQLGLHTATACDLRRRLWYHLLYLDVEASIANGLPRIVHEGDYDCPPPVLPDLQPAMALALQARWEWTTNMQRWLRQSNYDAELEAFTLHCRDLSQKAAAITGDTWARDFILLHPPRARCVLSHRQLRKGPWRPMASHESPVHAASREFLRTYISLATVDGSPYQWYLPGLVHPLHAVIILLLRMEQASHILLPECPDKALLEEAFALVGNRVLRGRLTPQTAGRPNTDGTVWIYCLLGKLKRRVWKKCGWKGGCENSRFCLLGMDEDENFMGHAEDKMKTTEVVGDSADGLEFSWEEWDQMVEKFFV
ncbi:hypothetical protein BZA05DRAFT_17 [Tricharina praecox]|uniref:uncharacterized protein n=1 Tax=Tricharina praecox TaxID=43433 RepID=UPI002220C91C|nr:uncharacterized protein BZA05DRAFT_17 [Tricharina praecox]KAI5858311.1 hypothetical protein BZA05DRAFT_17 [Tricharina praecox]